MPSSLDRDIDRGSSPRRPIRRFLHARRAWVEKHPGIRLAYRVFVGLLGFVIIVAGLLLVPLPGPGWLIVFLGLGILGTEFGWARRMSARLKRTLTRVWNWWRERRAKRAERARTRT